MEAFNHYAWGWTNAGNTPFHRWKRESYRGGTTDPFIVSWPKGIMARGEIRTQYAHIIDMVPTVLEALGTEAPQSIRGVTQAPIDGESFAHTFHDALHRATTICNISRCLVIARSTMTAGGQSAHGQVRASPRLP